MIAYSILMYLVVMLMRMVESRRRTAMLVIQKNVQASLWTSKEQLGDEPRSTSMDSGPLCPTGLEFCVSSWLSVLDVIFPTDACLPTCNLLGNNAMWVY